MNLKYTPDLANCEKEPIHIPGKIQGHGFLIATDKSAKIQFCSVNIDNYLPLTAKKVLGKPIQILENYLQKNHHPDLIYQLIESASNANRKEILNPYPIKINDASFNLIISTFGEFNVIEFEPELIDQNIDLQNLVGKSLSSILAKTQLSDLLYKSAEQIRNVIGYDRVMIYKFHKDGHGEVVAEDKDEKVDSFMGLHYPATDIPKQARELYKINLIRLIADVNEKPSEIIGAREFSDTPLDLTHSQLRAVSPVHIQYLKNMDVASSFSISLLHQGELWGLAACHNITPRFINYKIREAANLIGKVLSSTLSFHQQEENQQKTYELQVAVETLAKQLSQDDTIKMALFDHDVTLLDAVNASGVVLTLDNQIHTRGETPDEEFLKELIQWLNDNMQDQTYITNNLLFEFALAKDHKQHSSGILALRLSKELNDYLIWFRPELITKVNWAGDPDKPVEFTKEVLPISPRKSFEKWSQTVINTSLPWEREDMKSAKQLREEIASAIIRKAAETRLLNAKLNEAYNTLDAFSYTISHDLKNPLATISAYSQLLQGEINHESRAGPMVAGILRSAKKMNSMIKHILNYSKVGQSDMHSKKINMGKLLNEIRDELLLAYTNPELQIIIKETPEVIADEIMAMQVFTNLITNAVKYSSKGAKPVIIVEGRDKGSDIEYSISDNGIGIKPADKETIFELFKRSNEVGDFEGTGVGLAIVKRIIEKHEGKIWLESDGKTGSTFYVSFKKAIV